MTNLTSTEQTKGTANVSTTTIEKFQFQNVPSAADGGLIIDAEVRVVTIDGEPWFVVSDLAKILGYRDAYNLARRIAPEDKGTHSASTPGGLQEVLVINESGLYTAIMGSQVPQAEAFKRWVTSEVLPTIRKTGAYVDPSSELFQKIAEGDVEAMMTGFQMTLKIAAEARAKVAELETKVEEDKPYVEASKEFFDMEGLTSLRDSARRLGVPPLTFNDTLRGWNWIDEKGTAAKAYAVSMGYAENRIYIHPGSGAATTQGRLTNKGLERAAIKLEKAGIWRGYATS